MSAEREEGIGRKSRLAISACAAALLITVGGWSYARFAAPKQGFGGVPKGLVYSSDGYGGWVAAGEAEAKSQKLKVKSQNGGPTSDAGAVSPTPSAVEPKDALQDVLKDYAAGRFGEAQADGEKLAAECLASKETAERKIGVSADLIVAYSAARQKNMQQAREWFAKTRDDAAKLPDHGARPKKMGEVSPTIEEEAAYQHAVCTAALGEKAAAKREYIDFMGDYPESPLIHGAVKRITWMNGGDIPKDADDAWMAAMKVAKTRTEARQRSESFCGPECVAELLRRAGKAAVVEQLADEMKTSKDGTTIADLAASLKDHGFTPRGLRLTDKGLASQKLPLIAQLQPAHFVLLESIDAAGAKVWDPDANGPGKGAARKMSAAEWKQAWTGVVVTLK